MGRSYAVLVAALLASGCAETTSIYHAREVPADKARIVTTDAKQRSVLMIPAPPDDKGSTWRMCAEAAPDAFSALSASASLAADAKSQSGKVAAAIAETAGTIERTQTINLLRESMYRTCERWLSGALGRETFIIQAARDQRSMLAVLAIEQLTRAARPASTILTPAATSASVATGEAQAQLIADMVKERSNAAAARDDAQSAFKAVEAGCKNLPTPPADAEKAETWAICNTARGRLADLETELAAATARLNKLLDALGSGGLASGASASAGGGAAGPGRDGDGSDRSNTDLSRIAEAVERIATVGGIDETLMFCIALLTEPRNDLNSDVATACLSIIRTRANNDEALRSVMLNYDLQGADVIATAAAPDGSARRILEHYVRSATRPEEQKRRLDLVGAASSSLPTAARDIPNLIAGPRAAEILTALRRIETDPGGRSALGDR